tara:strand:- start:399 stop:530 length:132 start_codon:yes stop_codon:yes gene_type:complete
MNRTIRALNKNLFQEMQNNYLKITHKNYKFGLKSCLEIIKEKK